MKDTTQNSAPEKNGNRTFGRVLFNSVLMAVLANSEIIKAASNPFDLLREGFVLIPEVSLDPFVNELGNLVRVIADLDTAVSAKWSEIEVIKDFEETMQEGINFYILHVARGVTTRIIKGGMTLDIGSDVLLFNNGKTVLVLTNDNSGINQIIVNNSQVCGFEQDKVNLRNGKTFEISGIKRMILDITSMISWGICKLPGSA